MSFGHMKLWLIILLMLNLPHTMIFQSNSNLPTMDSIIECDRVIALFNFSTSKFPKSSHFFDKAGSEYEFRQFMGTFDFDPCSWPRKFRRKRDFESLQQYFDRAHVTIDSVNSSFAITQLINISSDRSTITVKERTLALTIFSDKSNVKIKPDENLVNISVDKPTIIMNSSQDQSFEMKTMRSEVFVIKKSEIDYLILIESGLTNMTLTQNLVNVNAYADQRSRINIRNQADVTNDRIFINSKIIDQQSIIRQLDVTCYAKNVMTEIELITGTLSISYNQTLIEISAKTHEIFVHVGSYVVRIATIFSSFNISITDLITINIDNATIFGYPQNNNLTALVPYSLMKVWADNETTLKFGGTALTNAHLNVESRSLLFELEPSASKVRSISFNSLSLLNTSQASNFMIRSNKTTIEVLSGIPYFQILTGNTSIELKYSTLKWQTEIGPLSPHSVRPTIGFQGEQDTSRFTVHGDTDHSIMADSTTPSTAALLLTTVIPTEISMSSRNIAQELATGLGSTTFIYLSPFTYPVEIPEPFPDNSTIATSTTSTIFNSIKITESTAEGRTSVFNTAPPLPTVAASTWVTSSFETTTIDHTRVQVTTPAGFTCIRSTINPSSDVVCIEAEITSIQVPAVNSTTISQETSLISYESSMTPTFPNLHENSDNFVITQYSVATAAVPFTRPLHPPQPAANVGNATVDEIFEFPTSVTTISEQKPMEVTTTVALAFREGTSREPLVPSPAELANGDRNSTERKLAKRYVLMQNPPEDENILSVALRVKKSIQLNSDDFLEPVKKGLREAYVEGKNRRLGIKTNSRVRRQTETDNASKNETKLNVELISVDRPSIERAIVRFFVIDGANAVDAAKAKETYDQLDTNELSALITHPVLSLEHHDIRTNESVELIKSVLRTHESDFPSETVLVVVVLVLLGLILLATALALIFHKKHKEYYAEADRKSSTSEQCGAKTSIPETNKSAREVDTSANQSLKNGLTSLPAITNGVLRTSKDLSPSDVLSFYNTSYSLLFDHVKMPLPQEKKPYGFSINKVGPTDNDANDGVKNRKWLPSVDYAIQQNGTTAPDYRRKIAQNVLDRSFPLENVRIEDILADKCSD